MMHANSDSHKCALSAAVAHMTMHNAPVQHLFHLPKLHARQAQQAQLSMYWSKQLIPNWSGAVLF